MIEYSVIADLLHTFRTMSDGVKILAIYMPCVFGLSAMALYLHHFTTQKQAAGCAGRRADPARHNLAAARGEAMAEKDIDCPSRTPNS
ncbi:hypothetical protein [uncultured Agrobacterium sp.]|uniref:hypothetical protein n=1 Tax=uncultured Agrobacterium sp. TaxID=157277 RepID=UPI00258F5BD5|nr:hypothetical protein [uncultured Agrobacterium sp.]